MTKIRKQKRKKTFRANVNRKRLRNKLQKVPKIECEDVENYWEPKKSIRTNLKEMGLAYDPNEVLKIPSTKREILEASELVKSRIDEKEEEEKLEKGEEYTETNLIKNQKSHVAKKLEADARAPRERMFRLPKSQVHFVTYLMEKYGDDYKAMARDRKNQYQMTWCQIRAKINTFKKIPEQYAEYLLKTGEIVLDDPEPLEETRRKIGIENATKYSAPRKRKLPAKESTKSIWNVDSVENGAEEFCTDEKEQDSSEIKSKAGNGLKKLKLFSDDEMSDDEINGNKKTNNSKKLKAKKRTVPEKNNETLIKFKQDAGKSLKKVKKIEKSQSSDSDEDDEEFEGDDDAEGFLNLSDMSEEEISEDDVLDDGEFVSDDSD